MVISERLNLMLVTKGHGLGLGKKDITQDVDPVLIFRQSAKSY
jgi:hypothetical protein